MTGVAGFLSGVDVFVDGAGNAWAGVDGSMGEVGGVSMGTATPIEETATVWAGLRETSMKSRTGSPRSDDAGAGWPALWVGLGIPSTQSHGSIAIHME
jgi:hypothetical protein